MRTTKNITADTMQKVWALHGKRVDNATIGAVVGVSTQSVTRIIDIMTLAKARETDSLREYRGGNYAAQKKMACEYFGCEYDPAPPTQLNAAPSRNEQPPAVTNNDEQFVEISDLLRRQCELLERLCAAWGA